MAKFQPFNQNDTKELRRILGLPITKQLRYMERVGKSFAEHEVIDYVVADIYKPSMTYSLCVTIDTGEVIRVIAPYFEHMQKASFVRDMQEPLYDSDGSYVLNKDYYYF